MLYGPFLLENPLLVWFLPSHAVRPVVWPLTSHQPGACRAEFPAGLADVAVLCGVLVILVLLTVCCDSLSEHSPQ